MTTLTDLIATTDWDRGFDPHLDADTPIPIIDETMLRAAGQSGQAQGDVYVLIAGPGVTPHTEPGDTFDRFDVIEGQDQRNPHSLYRLDGNATLRPGPATGYEFDVATLHIEPGGVCFLLHPEHGGNGIGPGTYVLRRQREQADTIRAVAD